YPTLLFLSGVRGVQMMYHSLVMPQRERDFEAAQGNAPDDFFQPVELGFLRTQELAPGGRVEEEIAHLHRRALGMSGRIDHCLHLLALCSHAPGRLFFRIMRV